MFDLGPQCMSFIKSFFFIQSVLYERFYCIHNNCEVNVSDIQFYTVFFMEPLQPSITPDIQL